MTTKRLLPAASLILALGGCAMPTTQNSALVQSGYEHIVNQQWSEAEADLLDALDADADNPYALLNLGVVYQQTGREAEAREMYNRVIESGTSATAARSNIPAELGKPLSVLAEENLNRLGMEP